MIMPWTHPGFAAVVRLVGDRTGLAFSQERRDGVEMGIRRAMGRAGVGDASAYARRVAADDDAMDDLIAELTVGGTAA